MPVIDPATHDVYAAVSKGAYVLEDAENPQVVLIGTGSEVWPAMDAAKLLAADGIRARVVSMPSWRIFEEQSADYKASVLPAGVPRLAVEAGSTLGWWKYVGLDGDVIGLDRFGASAPGPIVMKELGFSPRKRSRPGQEAGEVRQSGFRGVSRASHVLVELAGSFKANSASPAYNANSATQKECHVKLVIASDHAGFDLKEEVRAYLTKCRS